MALVCILHTGIFLGFPSLSLPWLLLETWQPVVEAGLRCLGAAFDPGRTLLSKRELASFHFLFTKHLNTCKSKENSRGIPHIHSTWI